MFRRLAVPLGLFISFTLFATACGSNASGPGSATANPGSTSAATTPGATAPGSQPLQKASLRLDWVVSGYHAPFYLALARGYYKDEGIDLGIGAGNGSGAVTQAIGNGTDTFGLVDGGVMMNEVAKGLKVKMVMGDLQSSPMAIVAPASGDIRQPGDLLGKRLGASPGQATYLLLPAFLAANGLQASQIHVSVLSPAVLDQALLNGKVDANAGFDYIEIPRLEASGLQVKTFNYTDYGINVPSLGIVVADQTLSARSDLVKHFIAATIKGFDAARADPAAAIEALAQENPSLNINKSIYGQVLKLSFKLLSTKNTAGHPFGWMSAADWAAAQKLLVTYEGMKPQPDVSVFFSNEYLPGQ